MPLDPKLRSPNERPLFIVGAIFSALVWVGLAVSIVGLIYGLLIGAFLLIAHALFLAHVKGNAIQVGERQLPGLHARVRAACSALGLAEVPEVYVLQGGGTLNAFASKLLSRRFVVILSDLVDHCQDPRQLDFVVGHEVGHLAAGHLSWNAFLVPYHLLPWLGPAYSRAREYTCDLCGLRVVGDLEQSIRGLAVLAAGGKLAAQVDIPAFLAQRRDTGMFWPAVLELNASHPFLCKRAAALQEATTPGVVQPVGRHPMAWVLAPFLGVASGGSSAAAPLVAVAVIGILAAIAIPNFVKYQERARRAQEGTPAASPVAPASAPASLTAEQTESLEWVRQVRQQIAERERAAAQGAGNRGQ